MKLSKNYDDIFDIKGRGKVYMFTLEENSTRTELYKELYNKIIKIDDGYFIVTGIDMFCIENQRKGTSIGLLVREV